MYDKMSGVKYQQTKRTKCLDRQEVRSYCPDMATIAELRKATGKSRALVAADLDMSERHLYRLENGKSPLRRMLALAFANYFGVNAEEIDGQESEGETAETRTQELGVS